MGIKISTGLVSVPIERDGEEVGFVRFSASDPALLARLKDLKDKAKQIVEESGLGESDDLDAELEKSVATDKKLRDMLDGVFGAGTSETVFGDSFCFTTCGGETAMEQFLNGIQPVIVEATQKEMKAVEARRGKYLDKYSNA